MKLNSTATQTIIVFFVLIISILFSAKWLVQWGVNYQLAEDEITLRLAELNINLLNGSVMASGVVLSQQDTAFIGIDSLYIDVAIIELLKGNIAVEESSVSGLSINTALNGNILKLENSLIELPLADTKQNTVNTSPQSAPSDPIPITVKQLSITNSQISLNAEKHHSLEINTIDLSDLMIMGDTLSANFDVKTLLNNRAVELSGKVDKSPNKIQADLFADVNLQIADYAQWLPVAFKTTAAKVNLKLGAQAHLQTDSDSEVLNVSSNDIALAVNDINTTIPQYQLDTHLSASEFTLNLTSLSLNQNITSFSTDLTANLNFALSNLNVNQYDHVLLAINHISGHESDLVVKDDWQFNVKNIAVDNSTFMALNSLNELAERDIEVILPLAEINQAKLDNLTLSASGISLDSVDINAKQFTLYRTADNAVANLLLPPTDNQQPELPTSTEDKAINHINTEAEQSQFAIKVDNFVLAGKPSISLYDFATVPAVEQIVNIDTLTLTNLQSQPANSQAQFELIADTGKRSAINIQGEIEPFNDEKNMNAAGFVKGLNLTPYSPYVSQSLGYDIEKGLMYAEFDFSINKQEISGKVNTEIKAIALSESQTLSAAKQQPSIVPLNIALKQLTDSKGNLVVEVPLSGNVNDPNFGLSGLIEIITTKALTQGAKNYMVKTFLPYSNVIQIAMMASDTLFEITINDLNYQAEQVALQVEQTPFVEQLGLLLQEKSERQLTVCPTVVFDKSLLTDNEKENVKLKKQLNLLGKQRVEYFIDHMIENYQITEDRLIPCKTKISSAESAVDKLAFEIK